MTVPTRPLASTAASQAQQADSSPATVAIPSHLESYTGGAREVRAQGSTLSEVISDLDRQYPGLRFRIIDEQDRLRPHIKLFIGQDMAASLDELVKGELVTITAALSGG